MYKPYFGHFEDRDARRGYSPKERVAFEKTEFKEGIDLRKLSWGKNIGSLIEQGRIILGTAKVESGVHGALVEYSSRVAYKFTPEAEKEWREVIADRINTFDFSESF